MEATTSATLPHQPQATHWWHLPQSLLNSHTPWGTLKCLHGSWESGRPHCVDHHTIHSIQTTHFTINLVLVNAIIQPFTLAIVFFMLHWAKATQLGAPQVPWQNVLFCMPLVCNHSCPRQWPSHCMPLAHAQWFEPSRRHRVTVPTSLLVETVDDTMQTWCAGWCTQCLL